MGFKPVDELSDKPSVHRATIAWDGGDSGDPRAHTVRLAEQSVAASGAEVLGGDPAKADPEEMFVASLSSCHMLWFLGLARAMRIRVSSYEDEAEGEMDGHCFTKVVLRPRVSFEGEVDDETLDSLHHRAHERCFIANTVSCLVEVEVRR